MRTVTYTTKSSAAIVVYKSNGEYGTRPHEYDWREGDKIFAKDGKSMQRVVKIVPNCPEVLNYLKRVFSTYEKYSGAGHTVIKEVSGRLVEETTIFEEGGAEEYMTRCLKHMPSYKF